MHGPNIKNPRQIALLGNHLPRRCGIATFTTDLADALVAESPDVDCLVLAMNDADAQHDYPARVRMTIADGDPASYRKAAAFLNASDVDVLCLQHEYGIFGGKAGSHLLGLLRELRIPIVTTLHTILGSPNPDQKRVMDEVVRLSQRLIVMSADGVELLHSVHGVPKDRIDLIPHGIPVMPETTWSKDQLGIQGKSMILTFGLLSPDKGLEYVVEAMPAILERHPEAVYVVLGATHPHVKEKYGEEYRRSLETLARKLGVDASIIFHDRFVSIRQLTEFLASADIYITPYLNPEQITSGTLAYAIGAGKAVLSTPYRYAQELLADGRGVLVPFRDSKTIAAEVNELLSDDGKRTAMGTLAASFARDMGWPAVARRYIESMDSARAEYALQQRVFFEAKPLSARSVALPELNLSHLRLMTDDTGLLQHGNFSVPRYEDGYCLDDNARALLLTALLEEAGTEKPKALRLLASRYLAFVSHAFDKESGRFRNFMSFSRVWNEECGSEDSHSRALWALGAVVNRSTDPNRQSLAENLFHAALPPVAAFTSPRAWAFALLGVDEFLRAIPGHHEVEAVRTLLAERLLGQFQTNSSSDWLWCEDLIAYDNARLPQALIVSGARMNREEMTTMGMRSLRWLAEIQVSASGYFAPVGSDGFYPRGGKKAEFDQQPVEAWAMISACLDAYRVSGDERYNGEMHRAFQWFLGQNHLHRTLHDPKTGGCRDGVHESRVNENQGAESTLSFLLALTEMRLAGILAS